MAMKKEACGLGCGRGLRTFQPGERLNYFGLTIESHVTVQSIPTTDANLSTTNKGIERGICIVGDNHSMTAD
jgi:hypothetical protein